MADGSSKKRTAADKLLTTTELAEYLNVCEHTIYRWCKTGKIPHFSLNSNYRFEREEIRRWLDAKHRQEQPPKPRKSRAG
ncbi:helix-turn-helix domain-containing protein [Candidatus Sumerlaeota bacterium]|nr:helix-turn-helix domain-containing protein [Candidatus Sumerlaeota bacterium]